MSWMPMKPVLKTSTLKVADLISKIEQRVNEVGGENINLGRFMKEADYRSELVYTYSNSEDVQLRELAREAIDLNIVEQIELQDFHSTSASSVLSWISDNFYSILLGTIILTIGVAATFFAYERSQTQTDAMEMASVGAGKPKDSANALESAKPDTTPSNENTKQQPVVERPKIILRMHGTNTLGASLVPALTNAYLESIGANDPVSMRTNQPVEKYIQGYLPATEEAVAVEIFTYGSSTAFKNLAAGHTDIVFSSRPMTPEERDQLRLMYGNLASSSEIVIGLDGLTVIVNKHNPIASLTTYQVAALFAGEFTNWSHVGGSPGPVNTYVPYDNSDTYHVFDRIIIDRYNKKLGVAAKRYKSNIKLSDDVSKDPNAIGFVDLSDVLRAKPLAIAASDTATPFFPTSFTIASEDYPLTRRIYFYAVANIDNPHIQSMVNFTLSETGQEIVKQAGVITQNINAVKPSTRPGMPKDYLALTKNSERLSVTFHFKFDSTELDNKGKRDLTRLIKYMEKHPSKRIMLFGFSDNIGSADANLQLSQVRAHIVENHLLPFGLSPIVVKGFGEVLPIASNHTAFGRYKNRRVEVWVN